MTDAQAPDGVAVPALKDRHRAHPVATAWRPTLTTFVGVLSRGDFSLLAAVPGVDPLAPPTERQIEASLARYGEDLAPLSDDTWNTSVSQWMDEYWELLVDLWTVQSGRSDLVLAARVFEDGGGYRIVVQGVYVP